jgi:hypothetical protein
MPYRVVTPQAMSFIAMPTLAGRPPGCPVIIMMPDMPCAMMSKPPLRPYGPVWPKPDIEA